MKSFLRLSTGKIYCQVLITINRIRDNQMKENDLEEILKKLNTLTKEMASHAAKDNFMPLIKLIKRVRYPFNNHGAWYRNLKVVCV